MSLLALIIQLVSGAIGGQVAGSLLKENSLGSLGNSIVGAIGGGIGGQLLGLAIPALGGVSGAAGFDIGTLLAQVAGGGVAGAIVTAIVGFVRRAMSAR
jgi:hypothetical protein